MTEIIDETIEDLKYRMKKETCDKIAKEFMSDVRVFSEILHQVTDEFKDMEVKDIEEFIRNWRKEQGLYGNDISGDNVECISLENENLILDKLITVPVPGTDDNIKMIVDLEPQLPHHKKYRIEDRALYHTARLINQQKGKVFVDQDYQMMRKVYCVFFLIHPDRYYRDRIITYSLKGHDVLNDNNDVKSIDKANIVLIGLTEGMDSAADIINILSIVMEGDLTRKQRDDLLSERYNMSVSDVIYEEAEKMESVWESGYSVGVFEGEERGLAKGITQGIQEGMAQGILEERNRNIKENLDAYIMMIESKKITKDDLDELPINDELRSAILKELSKRGQ